MQVVPSSLSQEEWLILHSSGDTDAVHLIRLDETSTFDRFSARNAVFAKLAQNPVKRGVLPTRRRRHTLLFSGVEGTFDRFDAIGSLVLTVLQFFQPLLIALLRRRRRSQDHRLRVRLTLRETRRGRCPATARVARTRNSTIRMTTSVASTATFATDAYWLKCGGDLRACCRDSARRNLRSKHRHGRQYLHISLHALRLP